MPCGRNFVSNKPPTNMSARSIAIAGLAAVLVLSACEKEDNGSSTNTPGGGSGNSTASTTPSFSDADGVLAATRAYVTISTPLGPQEIIAGLAAGAFSNDQFANLVNVGAVSCNGELLGPQAGNAYAYIPPATSPTGIDLTASNEVTWVAGGGSGFSSFTRTIMGPYPATGGITSSSTVVRASGHTLTVDAVVSADSVLFAIGPVARTLAGNATACTFSAAELSSLVTGSALAQVVAYNSANEVIGGKRIYFVKQSLRSQSVTVQ